MFRILLLLIAGVVAYYAYRMPEYAYTYSKNKKEVISIFGTQGKASSSTDTLELRDGRVVLLNQKIMYQAEGIRAVELEQQAGVYTLKVNGKAVVFQTNP
ncbi:hypothetical protein [Undibacterium curvum]|uniref:Uncharacterized protein n=1 Tax=Undibacterium curvum TaxID=2762294 RepID=A0ABR7A0C5_9BURK|nr:hypothetical protein [Undibacterium curvum]MBC3930133.1 hypothetical protein [Undibacterium curvum]